MERKKVNKAVLFFDRKGFYKESLGKEASVIADELDEFYQSVIDAVDKHKGEVVKFMGDAGLVTFDAVDDAVRFARELGSWKGYDSNLGIEFGEIVHGTFGKKPCEWVDIIGEPVNEAAKNMSRAAKSGKGIVLGPRAWVTLTLEDRLGLASSEGM